MCGSSQGPTIINANILQQTVLNNTEISVALTHLHQDRCPFPHHIWYNRHLGCSWRSRPVCGWAFAAVGSGSASGNRKRACVVYIYAVRTGGTAQFWIPSDIFGGGGKQQEKMDKCYISGQWYCLVQFLTQARVYSYVFTVYSIHLLQFNTAKQTV